MSIFEQREPDILMKYRGEGFWQHVKRYIQNTFRWLTGDEPLGYDERNEFDDEWEGDWGERHE